jgi:hypothetical protein
MDKCEAGCKVFYGGEIRHHPDCIFYPESFSKLYDVLKKHTDTDMMEFAEWCSDYYSKGSEKGSAGLWYKNGEFLSKKRFTTTQLLQDFKDWKEANNG